MPATASDRYSRSSADSGATAPSRALDVRCECLVVGSRLVHDDDSGADCRMGLECGLDLTRLDTEAADLRLIVDASNEDQVPSERRRTTSPVR